MNRAPEQIPEQILDLQYLEAQMVQIFLSIRTLTVTLRTRYQPRGMRALLGRRFGRDEPDTRRARGFVIREFQRPYTWERDETEELWNDLSSGYGDYKGKGCPVASAVPHRLRERVPQRARVMASRTLVMGCGMPG